MGGAYHPDAESSAEPYGRSGTGQRTCEKRDYEALFMLYDSVPNVLSELIRTAFVAGEGNKFCVTDFSAIEARVLSWADGRRTSAACGFMEICESEYCQVLVGC